MVAEGVFVTGLFTSYCTVEDVLRLLAGYDLSRLGDEERQKARIRELLPATRAAIDAEAGRDFLFHAEAEVWVDGGGSDRLLLSAEGVVPVWAVRRVEIGGVEVAAREYVCYGDEGTLRMRPGGRWGGVFPKGVQNVRVVLDWGYRSPPEEISLAQAKLVAAQVLGEMAGDRGSVESVRLGDYAVTYDAGGENASVVRRWAEDARRAAGSYRAVRMSVV